jgi:hypothetical protein
VAQSVRVHRANRVLDEEIATLKEQVSVAKRRHSRQPGVNGATSGPSQVDQAPGTLSTSQSVSAPREQGADSGTALEMLAKRAWYLEQIQSWITADSDLLPLIARVAGNAEEKYMRKNLLMNVVLSTIFLIAGWLLSIAATPSILGDIFRH